MRFLAADKLVAKIMTKRLAEKGAMRLDSNRDHPWKDNHRVN